MTAPNPSDEPAPRRRSWRPRVLAAAAILIVALGVFAWQQGSGDGGGSPLNAIAQAAEKTNGEPGGRATMRAVVTSPDQAPIEMSGRLAYDQAGREQMAIRFPDPHSGGQVTIQGVMDEDVMYLRSSALGSLPDGKEWMKIDFSSFGVDGESSAPAVNAKGELAVLEAATGPVQKLGEKRVRGVQTTGYRGTLSASDNAARLREEGVEEELVKAAENDGPLEVEAWIDGKGLVRRMRLVKDQRQPDGGRDTIDMTIDFFDFGAEPEIEAPDSSEVFDATDLAHEGVSHLAEE
jgi:hypothetical protein